MVANSLPEWFSTFRNLLEQHSLPEAMAYAFIDNFSTTYCYQNSHYEKPKPELIVSLHTYLEDELKFQKIYFYELNEDKSKTTFYYQEGSFVWCNFTSNQFDVRVISKNLELFTKIKSQLILFTPFPEPSCLHMLSSSKYGDLNFEKIASVFSILEEDNYSPSIMNGIQHVVKDILSKDPCGKLTILEGEPGTGKTHLVKGIASRLDQDYMLILVPPNMISSFDSPSFVPTLKEMIIEKETKKLVFLLEDADVCLVPRGSDNIGSISNLLNLSDGMIGTLADIRIIATTNAKKIDIDPALLRRGRLCKHIEVGKLPPEQATRIFQRLISPQISEFKFLKPIILADIYYEAKNFKESIDMNCNNELESKQMIGF